MDDQKKQEESKEPTVIESAMKKQEADEAAAEAAFSDKVMARDELTASPVSDPGECGGVGESSMGSTPQETQEIMRTIRTRVHVLVTRVHEEDREIDRPEYGSIDASGADLRAAKDTVIPRLSAQLVKTGIKIVVPPGYEAQVRSRSGLALKKQVFVLNSPGTIDADYRGEVGVILFNAGTMPYEVKRGDKIAQLVITTVCAGDFAVVPNEVYDQHFTERGEGGFGSTGK